MLKYLAVALALLLGTTVAHAKHRHYSHVRHHLVTAHKHARIIAADPGCNVLWPCAGVQLSPRGVTVARKVGFGVARPVYTPRTERIAPQKPMARSLVVQTALQAMQESRGRVVADSRPADCYGIAWCGCWLRHHMGLSDTRLNLASAWAGVGRPTEAHAGAVVVWRHHVGLITSEPVNGVAMVRSGNDGHAVRERPLSLRRAIAFRDI